MAEPVNLKKILILRKLYFTVLNTITSGKQPYLKIVNYFFKILIFVKTFIHITDFDC